MNSNYLKTLNSKLEVFEWYESSRKLKKSSLERVVRTTNIKYEHCPFKEIYAYKNELKKKKTRGHKEII